MLSWGKFWTPGIQRDQKPNCQFEEPGAKTGCQNKGRVLSMRTALNTIYCSRCLIAKSCPTLSTLWTAARQVSLFFTISQSLLKLMSIDLGMLSNPLILCRPLLLLPSIFPSTRVFPNESALHIRWPKCWIFSFSISSSNEYSGLISFRTNWSDLLEVQGTLKSLLQQQNSKASILTQKKPPQ